MKKKFLSVIHSVLTSVVFLLLATGCKKDDDSLKITDIDGNVYDTVTIGTQTWMKENLKTTHYADGSAIPLVNDNAAWINLTTPGYCWYDNDRATYAQTYGALYNWHTVNTGKLCPTGWHVPTSAEWETLITYLGGWIIAGGKLKETGTEHWQSPNEGATNESGFTAHPGGWVSGEGFTDISTSGPLWSSTQEGTYFAWSYHPDYQSAHLGRDAYNKGLGFSVRCIKNL